MTRSQWHREPARLHYKLAETGGPACGAGRGRGVASAAPPPHETPPAEPRAVVASGTEGAAVAARLARESGTEPEDKGDAPSAEELATGKPAPRGRRT